MDLATTLTVSGTSQWLIILAVIAFLVAAIVAWFVQPRAHWATAVSLGLMIFALSFIVK